QVQSLKICVHPSQWCNKIYCRPKAFDRVDEFLLVDKLRKLGFNENTVLWITSFLSNRWQQVKIGDCISESFKVTSGVPQGSHRGPILFLLFINDLCQHLTSSKFLFYADDLKIYTRVECSADVVALQSDLDILFNWCEDNNLFLNINKCKSITFCNKRKNVILSEYRLGNSVLSSVNEIKDLGVVFDSRLTFK